MSSVIVPSVVLSEWQSLWRMHRIRQSVVIPSGVMLNVIVTSVVAPSVVMLNVVVPFAILLRRNGKTPHSPIIRHLPFASANGKANAFACGE